MSRRDLEPAAVVLVATVKALKYHGEGSLDAGAANLTRHVELVRRLGWEPVVAVNAYPDDTLADLHHVRELALDAGARDAEIADGFRLGGEGTPRARRRGAPRSDATPQAARAVSTRRHDRGEAREDRAACYGAAGIELEQAERDIAALTSEGLERPPDLHGEDPALAVARPDAAERSGRIHVADPRVRAYTGAGWLTAFCGDVLTMPGLPAEAAAMHIDIDDDGRTVGLW